MLATTERKKVLKHAEDSQPKRLAQVRSTQNNIDPNLSVVLVSHTRKRRKQLRPQWLNFGLTEHQKHSEICYLQQMPNKFEAIDNRDTPKRIAYDSDI